MAAAISLFDTKSLHRTDIPLPNGSTNAIGLCISPDGRWAYVVHTLARYKLPITQLERGWVHTYALSLIDLAKKSVARPSSWTP